MKENNKNGIYIIITVILCLIFGTIGFIYGSKLSEKEDKTTQNEPKSSQPTDEIKDDNDINSIEKLVSIYPKENDSKVTGDNVYKEFNLENLERHSANLVFDYNNYKFIYNYLDGGVDSSKITILDKNTNKELYKNEYVKTIIIDENDNEYNSLPTISDGKLHLTIYNPDNCYINESGEKEPYFEYIQIDLTDSLLSEKTITSIKDIRYGYAPICK